MDRHIHRAQYLARKRREARRRKIIAASTVGILVVAAVGVFAFMNAGRASEEQPATDVLPVGNEATQQQNSESKANAENIVMTLFGDKNTLVLKGEDYIESGCHAVDTTKNENISNIKVEGSVDTSKTGDYQIKYTATDSTGKKATCERKVSVVDSFDGGNAQAVPVCMYHYVYDETNKPDEVDNNWIEASLLEQEILWTKENNFYYPSYEELAAFVDGKKTLPMKSIIFTFDDGKPEFLQSGIPLFNKCEVPATSFVICSDADASEKVFGNPSKFVQYQSHSYAMHVAGSNVGRGGRIHACSYDEILDDQKQAAALTGNSQAYAYPFGDHNETAEKALQDAGVICAFTIENRAVKPGDDKMALPRVRISGSYSFEQFCALVS